MPFSHKKLRLDNLADEIWKPAKSLCNEFKTHENQNVILRIIVIQWLERMIIEWRIMKPTRWSQIVTTLQS